MSYPDRKSGAPFCDFANRWNIDGKSHTTATDLKRINFVNLFYSFIFNNHLQKFVDDSQIIR